MRAIWKVVCLLSISLPVFAHSPHHVIDALELSPDYENDSTVFVLVHNYLLRSAERGASWKQLVSGIDSPYVLSDISISGDFAADDMLFVSTDGGGIFKSIDRGQSWKRFNVGLRQANIGKLLMSAGEGGPLLLAAGSSNGLFASPVQDADWHRLISDDVQITALAVMDASESSYALAGDSKGGIWKSDGSLRDWRRIFKLDNVGAVTSFANGQSRGLTKTLLVGTEKSGLLLLSDGGVALEHLSRQWPDNVEDCAGRQLATPVPDLHVRDIKSSDDGVSIFVTTWHRAVHVSRDTGKSWKTLGQGLRCNVQADSAGFATPHFRGLETGGKGQQDWFLASFEGLYRSEDRGKSWLQFETMPVSLIRGLGISPASGNKHKLVVTTYGGGAYTSADLGQSWTVANDGLVSTRLADAEFSPGYWNDHQVFGLARERLLVSDKNDNSWNAESLVYDGWRRRVGFGLERRLGFSAEFGSDLFLDNSERSGVWPMQIELSPSFATDQTMLVGFRRHGVWISDDGGGSWNRDWEGPTDYVTDLKISPDFSSDGTVFAGIRGAGIYVTRDGAKSWRPANAGFEYFENFQATKSPNHFIDPPLSRAITDIVLAVSPEFTEDQTVFAGSVAGLFRSTDGGRAWQELTIGSSLENAVILGVAISPVGKRDQMIVASVKGRGIYRTTDGGQSFESVGKQLLQNNVEMRFIRFSPSFHTDNTIYGASDWDLWVSRDKGVTWTKSQRPVRYEDWRGGSPGPLWFSGSWKRETGPQFSALTQTTTDQPGAYATLNFIGRTINWSGERGPSGGMARIVIDGVEVAIADLYSEQESSSASIFKVADLPDKPHNVVIEVLDDKNLKSTGRRVAVDNIDVIQR